MPAPSGERIGEARARGIYARRAPRCNLPGAFDLIGAPCDCPCSASGAGVPVWRNSVFVTFCWRLLRSSALLLRFLLHFVGNADVGERIDRKPSNWFSEA